MKILLAEDDRSIAQTLGASLRGEGFDVHHVADGNSALRAAVAVPYDIILLDVALPGRNGDAVARHLRDANIGTAIIVVSGLLDVKDKLRLFAAGVDDYLAKPFAYAELRARMKAVLRKRNIPAEDRLAYGEISMNLKDMRATRGGDHIPLRNKEFKILEYFLMHPEQVLTRDMIMHYVWGPTTERYTNVVDVHIHHLREKIDKPYAEKMLHTVNSVGYKISRDS